MTSNELVGVLKQQCVDEKGIFEWKKRLFKLDIDEATLSFTEEEDVGRTPSSLSLSGATLAKEWSFSSAMAGYGFDLVWSSGKLWSFLLDQELQCQAWVSAINTAIASRKQQQKVPMLRNLSHNSSQSNSKSNSNSAFHSNNNSHSNSIGASNSNSNNNTNSQSQSHSYSGVHSQSHGNSYSDTHGDSNTMRNTIANSATNSAVVRDNNSVIPNNYQNNNINSNSNSNTYNSVGIENIPANIITNSHGNSYEQNYDNSNSYSNYNGDYNSNSESAVRIPKKQVRISPKSFFITDSYRNSNYWNSNGNNDCNSYSNRYSDSNHNYDGTGSSVDRQIITIDKEVNSYDNSADNSVPNYGGNSAVELPKSVFLPQNNNYTIDSSNNNNTITGNSYSNDVKASGANSVTTLKDQLFSVDEIVSQQQPPVLSAINSEELYNQCLSSTLETQHKKMADKEPQEKSNRDELLARCKELEEIVERRNAQVLSANEQVERLQKEINVRTNEFEKHLQAAWDREKKLLTETKNDLETKLLRASNDSHSHHEATLKALQIQHEREISCLQEELSEERKRYKSQLASEQSTRNRLENENAEYRRDFTKLQDQVASLTIENNKLRECNNADTNNYHREKVILIEAHNHKINKMEEEIKQIHLKYQEDLKERVDEMNKKYAKSLETVKEMEMNIFRQKLEGEKMRNFSELQKKFIVDIETVRTEERKVATVEIERIRSEYMSKEKETVADLTELERLHTQRVQQLEQQCLLLRTKNGELDDYIKKLENDKFLLVNEHQTITNSYKKKLQDSENQSQLLQVHLRQTEDEIISITSKENKLREDLKQALIDNQLLRAELYEARQQASQGNIHAEQWQRATQESELSITAAKTTAQIAKDEVLMLEHELQRLRDENLSLKDELYRADRVIFGIPQHQSDPRTFLTTIEPELRRSQETNPAFSVGMNATQLIRSETANSVGNKENSRKLTKKALFSPTLPHQPAKGITPATVTRYKPAHTVSSNNKTKKSTTKVKDTNSTSRTTASEVRTPVETYQQPPQLQQQQYQQSQQQQLYPQVPIPYSPASQSYLSSIYPRTPLSQVYSGYTRYPITPGIH